jgi:hypothetical protein
MICFLTLECCVLKVIILSRQDYFEYFEQGTVSCLDPAVRSQMHGAHQSISCFHVAIQHLQSHHNQRVYCCVQSAYQDMCRTNPCVRWMDSNDQELYFEYFDANHYLMIDFFSVPSNSANRNAGIELCLSRNGDQFVSILQYLIFFSSYSV